MRVQALRLLEAMWEAGGELSPDTVSYNARLKACGNAAQMGGARQVWRAALPPSPRAEAFLWRAPYPLPGTCCQFPSTL